MLCSYSEDTVLFCSTPLENEFILEYMTQAPGDFVRVYIYMLFKCAHPSAGDSMAKTARDLGMNEDDVERAMRYWEREGLWRKTGESPAEYRFVGCRHRSAEDGIPMPTRDLNQRLQAIIGADYVIAPRDFLKINDWLEVFKLPSEVIIIIAEYEVANTLRRKMSMRDIFKRMDKLAKDLAESGDATPESARRHLISGGAAYEVAARVVKRFNFNRKPTLEEIALAETWLGELKATPDEIVAACAQTTSGQTPTFKYLDAIIRKNAGGLTANIKASNERHEAIKAIYRQLGVSTAVPPETHVEAYAKYISAGFDCEVLIEAARRCAREGRADFAAWEKYMDICLQKRLFSMEAFRASTKNIDRLTQAAEEAMRAYGSEKRAQEKDREWIDSWLAKLPMEVILYAGECSRGTQLPYKYMNKLMEKWSAAGVRSADEARAIAPKQAKGGAAAPVKRDYQERSYSNEDFANDALTQMIMKRRKEEANDAK